jgi:hypothetical protein
MNSNHKIFGMNSRIWKTEKKTEESQASSQKVRFQNQKPKLFLTTSNTEIKREGSMTEHLVKNERPDTESSLVQILQG